MNLGEICNREVVIVEPDSSATDAARLMRDYHVGDLVVAEERGGARVPVGILTDRDIVVEVVAKDVAIEQLSVKDIMSSELVTARENDSLLDTMKLMRDRGVRRLPVVDRGGALVGILAVDDLVELFAETLADLSGVVQREQQRERRQRR